jgi:YVTN family beta-propeller protein
MMCTFLLFISCPGSEEYMEDFAYVVNHYAHSVSMIDIDKAVSDPENPEDAVIITVTIPNSGEVTKGIAVSPNKRSVFVPESSYFAESLWIISAEDITEEGYAPSSSIPTGMDSVAVGVTPDGEYAYVVNKGDNTVSIVSIAQKSVVSTIDVGESPHHIAISPDGQYAYITNRGIDSTVSVIDTELALSSPLSAVSTVEITADPPKGIAVTPDGQYAYVATGVGDVTGNQVAVLDLTKKREVDTDDDPSNGITPIVLYETTQGAPKAVAITPDGTYAYVTNLASNPDGDDTV